MHSSLKFSRVNATQISSIFSWICSAGFDKRNCKSQIHPACELEPLVIHKIKGLPPCGHNKSTGMFLSLHFSFFFRKMRYVKVIRCENICIFLGPHFFAFPTSSSFLNLLTRFYPNRALTAKVEKDEQLSQTQQACSTCQIKNR